MRSPFNDLLFYCGAYFFFSIILMVAAFPWNVRVDYSLRTYIVFAVIGMHYGLSDEIHQSFVPNRECALSDFLADAIGVMPALATGKMWLCKRKVPASRKNNLYPSLWLGKGLMEEYYGTR